MTTGLLLHVLGECCIEPESPADRPATITSTQRRILARLALSGGSAVSIAELTDAVWSSPPPANARTAIQNQISRLRSTWGNDLVRTTRSGYELGCPTDADSMVASAQRAERLLEAGDISAAFESADDAIEHWAGQPYADIEHLPEVAVADRALHAALRGAEDLRLEAALRLGRPVWAAIEAERLHAADPLDERRQALRVRAMLLAGRRGEALAAANTARRHLRDELGVAPGPWLAAAEAEALGAVGGARSTAAAPGAATIYPISTPQAAESGDGVDFEEGLRGVLAALEPTEAITTAREVAAAANRSGEHQDAVRWLSRSLEIPDVDASTRLMLRIELGDAQRLAGDPAHLSTLIDVAHEAIEAGDERASAAACFALLQLGASTTSGQPIPEVVTIIEQALPRITEPELRAPVLSAASLASSLIGIAARSRELFTEAMAIPVSNETRARVLPFAYMAVGAPRDLPLRRTAADELSELAERLDDPVAAFEAAQLSFSVGLQEGDGERARAAVDEMASLVSRVGDTGRQWALLFARAAIAHLDGEDTKCEQLSERAQRYFSAVSPARAAAAHAGQLIALRVTQSRITELAPMLTKLTEAQPGIPAFQAAAALSVVGTDPESARSRATLALDLAQEDSTWLAGHAIGARAAAALGDAALCARYLNRLLPWSGLGIWQGTCSYGPVDTAIALLGRAMGDVKAADAHAARAHETAQSLRGLPFTAELCRAGFAQV